MPILFERRYRDLGHVFTCDGGRFGNVTLPESFTDRSPAGEEHALSIDVLVELLAEIRAMTAALTHAARS